MLDDGKAQRSSMKYEGRKSSDTGNRTPGYRVRGDNVSHYTISEYYIGWVYLYIIRENEQMGTAALDNRSHEPRNRLAFTSLTHERSSSFNVNAISLY